jgi:8-oxo-dGTP pyrophosphatase MutT (NUDIX family)
MKWRVTDDDGQKVGRQVAALPYRLKPELQVTLITSRDTGRWVLPKGWPMRGKTAAEAAAQEAWEEAGLKGAISESPSGAYRYDKIRPRGPLRCRVDVFPMRVLAQAGDWPEQGQRQVEWFSPAEAAKLVAEPELAALLAEFQPPET